MAESKNTLESTLDDSENSQEENEDQVEDEIEGLGKSVKKAWKTLTSSQCIQFKGEPDGAENAPEVLQDQLPAAAASEGTSLAESLDTDEYDFTHPKRGRAIVINNEHFDPYTGLGNRPGSSKDASSMKKLFNKLGFDVKVYDDLKATAIKAVLQRAATDYPHDQADCLAVTILSHGEEKLWGPSERRQRHDLIFGSDGRSITTSSIMDIFSDNNCPGLIGKPRIFFLQACRGTDYDNGMDIAVAVERSKGHARDDIDNQAMPDTDLADARPVSGNASPKTSAAGGDTAERDYVDGRIPLPPISPAPIYKNYIVMYATTPGHFAWRRESGSWFVQSLYEVFSKRYTPNMSLTQALTRVCKLVTQGYQSMNEKKPELANKKQTPVIQSKLIKDIYFWRK